MRKIFLFMMVSLDGYIEAEGHDLSWHHVDKEFNDFAIKQLGEADTILFGKRTYELMESFWPSEEGRKDDPEVARRMNETPKIVFSHTLEKVNETSIWKNVRLVKEHVASEIAKEKVKEGKSIVVLGSNNFCLTLLELGLLDEIRLMVNPVVIGKGTPLFAGIKKKVSFSYTSTRNFKNGNILLTYSPQ